ncbi:MAG TPA: ABC transporter ATP-binding protein [Phycisphaerales bacterium]|nr:ABC transporter ATP-binding protein [Phycisphaerales bacterium]
MSTPALAISDLKYRYPVRRGDDPGAPPSWVVDLPALTLEPGAQLLVTAPSGRGKSTLLYLVAGLLDPAGGSVRVAGQDIHALRGPARDRFRGRHVGMIFQTFNLLHGFSALENVMAAMMVSDIPAREHRPRAAELLSTLGIVRHAADPDALSVGQQQRVAVARALACAPELVLADEPTASLDPENAAAAVALIQEACGRRGAALLLVSHDPALLPRFERRLVLGAVASAAPGAGRPAEATPRP